MEVGKVGPISAYNTQKRTNSLNFQGRMVDDKIVKEILESIPKKPEGLSAKIIGWLRRSFYFAKSYHVDAQGKSLNLEAFELDSESKIINKDILKMLAERRRPYSVYSYKVLGDGTIPMIHKDIYNKDGIFVRHDFISLSRNDNYETHLFLKDRNKESFARSVRDLDGKLEYVLVDGFSPSSKVVERGKDGSLVRYERKGARLSYDARGRVEGYIDQGKDRFYFMGVDIKDFEARENLSLKSLKSIKNYFQSILRPYSKKEDQSILCERWNGDDFIGGVILPKDTIMDDILRMHRTGELQNMKLDIKKTHMDD